jgi:hypothetical protein
MIEHSHLRHPLCNALSPLFVAAGIEYQSAKGLKTSSLPEARNRLHFWKDGRTYFIVPK